ncbi:hypothetical protein NDU88_006836 [Pleurodeles waltl]|uniref:Uncharacterized protein n=1 Tax=Pleurodeles waltl TaxID=8319 RepID=A0AAV7UR71_PLEWA|nr:hypothetical protein NDU88_006836 [Pleurodeles waltl]
MLKYLVREVSIYLFFLPIPSETEREKTDYAGNARGSQSAVHVRAARTYISTRAASREQAGRADCRLLPLALIASPAAWGIGLERASGLGEGVLPAAHELLPEPLLPRGLLASSPQ